MKEKMKQKIKQTWNNKAQRYTVAGFFCLFLTIVILSLSVGSSSRAFSITYNGTTFNFTTATDTDGTYYVIDSGEQLEALGSITDSTIEAGSTSSTSTNLTSGKTFKLTQDLTLTSVTPATGIFKGTFDGNGHVITITDTNTIVKTSGVTTDSTDNKTTTAGILFGTVAEGASVQNLIIETGEINYKQTSDVGVDEGNEKKDNFVDGDAELKLNNDMAVYDTNSETPYKSVYSYKDHKVDKATTTLDNKSIEAGTYKAYETSSSLKSTKTNNASKAKNDYFGIICGELEGTITRVVIDGETLNVTQNIKASGAAESNREDLYELYYLYKDTTEAKSDTPIPVSDLEVSPTILEKTTTATGTNAGVEEGALQLRVEAEIKRTTTKNGQSKETTLGADESVQAGDSILYTITATPKETSTLSDITVYFDKKLTMGNDNEDFYTFIESDKVSGTTAYKITASYKLKDSDIPFLGNNDIKSIFYVTANDGASGQTIQTENLTVTTTLTNTATATTAEVKKAEELDKILKLTVTQTSATLDQTNGGTITYQFAFANNTGQNLSDVTVVDTAETSKLTFGTAISSLADTATGTITATYALSDTDLTNLPSKISFTVKVTAKVGDAENESDIMTGVVVTIALTSAESNVTATTESVTNIYKYTDTTKTLQLNVTADDVTIDNNSADVEITYNFAFTNNTGKTLSDVTVTCNSSNDNLTFTNNTLSLDNTTNTGKITATYALSSNTLTSPLSVIEFNFDVTAKVDNAADKTKIIDGVTVTTTFSSTTKASTKYNDDENSTAVSSSAILADRLCVEVTTNTFAVTGSAGSYSDTIPYTITITSKEKKTLNFSGITGLSHTYDESKWTGTPGNYTYVIDNQTYTATAIDLTDGKGTVTLLDNLMVTAKDTSNGMSWVATVDNITADVYDKRETAASSLTGISDLTATLSCPKFAFKDDEVTYTLTLTNNKEDESTAYDGKKITHTMDMSKVTENSASNSVTWNSSTSNLASITLPALKKGESASFTTTKTMSSENTANIVSVSNLTIPVTKYLPAYQYVGKIRSESPTKEGEYIDTDTSIYAGNSLYAGVFAGHTSAGATISESIQNCEITSNTTYEKDGVSVSNTYVTSKNTADLKSGLLVGSATKTINVSDLYLKTALDSSTLAGSGTLNLVTSANKNTTAKPESENWTSFAYYDDNGKEVNYFTLAWLVDENPAFTYKLNNDSTFVSVSLNTAKTTGKNSSDLSYHIAYAARRALSDEDKTIYYSSSDKFDLGESGYYILKNVYATDGYYHYISTPTEESINYPYFEDNQSGVIFDSDKKLELAPHDDADSYYTLDDNVFLSGFTLHEDLTAMDDNISFYYRSSKNDDWIKSISYNSTDNKASFAFTSDMESFVAKEFTPYLDGKYYPAENYNSASLAHTELPLPFVKTNFYTQDNGIDYISEDFVDENSYENGTLFTFDRQYGLTDCTYFYLFSDSNTVPLESAVDWISWEGEHFSIPEYTSDGNNTYYLYVKVTLDNYPTTIDSVGKFTVTQALQVFPEFYYNISDKKAFDAEKEEIAAGDILRFSLNQENLTDVSIQYQISGSNLGWQEYTENTVIKVPDSDSLDSFVVEYRIKKSNGDAFMYGPVDEKEYFFIDTASEISISPQTSSNASSGVTSISSGTTITLSADSANAVILYVSNETESTDFTITRVDASDVVSGNSAYYQVGERWYKIISTTSDEIIKGTSFELTNTTGQSVYNYVHAVVLMENMNPSEISHYVYSIDTLGKVSNPEAVLKTQNNDGGETFEIANAVQGSYLTFTSLTQGAKLYYAIGKDTSAPSLEYPTNGIKVEGEIGSNFIIRVQAVDTNKTLLDSDVVTFTYSIIKQDGIVAPTATPATTVDTPTVVLPGSKILLSSNTSNATIYYTTDGSEPNVVQVEGANGSYTYKSGNTSTKKYEDGITMPLDGSGYFIVHAINTKPDKAASDVVEFIYAYPDEVLSPYASVQEGAVAIGTKVFLKNRTEGATIYYTFAYGDEIPSSPTISSAVFDDSQVFEITQTTKIKAIAVKDGVKSSVVTFKYTVMNLLDAPKASLNSGSIISRGTTLKLTAAENAVIYYTLDGSEPNESGNASVIQGSSLVLDGEAGSQITVKAYATLEGMTPSEVVTFTYQISTSVAGITADIASGTEVSNGTKVNLTSDVTDAVIYYTIDGSSPLDKGIKGSSVTISGISGETVTVKAAAVLNKAAGSIVSFTYKIKEIPNAPTASPAGGVLTIATYVELSASTEKIYYTTDGTTPTESSNLYAEPILINKTTYLQAIAVSQDGESSVVSSFQYTAAAKAEKPTATLADGSVLEPGDVISLWTDTANATIYYSTDGTDPTLDNLGQMLEYTADGIAVQRNVTIKAVAYRSDMQLSNVSTYTYTVESIPAVEIRKEKEAKLAAEGLQDSDTSSLARTEDYEDITYQSYVLENEEYGAVVASSENVIPSGAKLVVEEKDNVTIAEDNVKQSFGEDYTILSSYDVNLYVGTTIVQPDGEVEIGIPIPEEYKNASVSIIYLDSENKVKKLETRRKDGMAYARVSHFSNYALVGRIQESESSLAYSYVLLLEVAAGCTLLFGIGFWICQKWKKNKKNL